MTLPVLILSTIGIAVSVSLLILYMSRGSIRRAETDAEKEDAEKRNHLGGTLK